MTDITYNLPFFNNSDLIVPAYGILKPTSIIDNSGHQVFNCVQPDNQLQPLYLVNSEITVAPGNAGDAGWFGLLWAAYDTSGAAPGFLSEWGIKPNSWNLWPQRGGFITGAANTFDAAGVLATGQVNRTLVNMRLITKVWVKLNAALPAGGSLTQQPVYEGKPNAAGGPETDSLMRIPTLYARPNGANPGALPLPNPIPANTFVRAEWIDGYWYATDAMCCDCPNTFVNVSGTTIPAFAPMVAVGGQLVGLTPALQMGAPAGNEPTGLTPFYYINTGHDVPPTGYDYATQVGTFQTCKLLTAKYQGDSNGAPVFGEQYGPEPGATAFVLLRKYPGFFYQGVTQTATVVDTMTTTISGTVTTITVSSSTPTVMLVVADPNPDQSMYYTASGHPSVPAFAALVSNAAGATVIGSPGVTIQQLQRPTTAFDRFGYAGDEYGSPGNNQPGNYQRTNFKWLQFDDTDISTNGSPTRGETYGPMGGSYKLERYYYGWVYEGRMKTVTIGSGSTSAVGWFRHDPATEIFVTSGSTLTAGGTVTCSVMVRTSKTSFVLADSGQRLPIACDVFLASGEYIGSSTPMIVRFMTSTNFVIEAKGCPL